MFAMEKDYSRATLAINKRCGRALGSYKRELEARVCLWEHKSRLEIGGK